jgi:hypothetical protein
MHTPHKAKAFAKHTARVAGNLTSLSPFMDNPCLG